MYATVFIPTGNRATSLNRTLESLTKQTHKDFEVIIVDYRSTDGTQTVIQSFRNKLKIRLIHQKAKGLAQAANLALQESNGSIFTRTDDDVVMKPGWLAAIVDTFKNGKNVGGVTGPTVIPDKYRTNRDLFIFENKFRQGNVFWKLAGKLYYGYFMEGRPYDVSRWFRSGAFALGSNYPSAANQSLHEINNLEACNFSVRTDLLKKVGGFDEKFSGVGEYHEADAAFKIKRLGYRLMFNPKAYLNHCPSKTGFYNDRPASYSRMVNFTVFYLRHIRVNSADKLARFSLYLIFLNLYYLVTAIRTRQAAQAGALGGTIAGIYRHFTYKQYGF